MSIQRELSNNPLYKEYVTGRWKDVQITQRLCWINILTSLMFNNRALTSTMVLLWMICAYERMWKYIALLYFDEYALQTLFRIKCTVYVHTCQTGLSADYADTSNYGECMTCMGNDINLHQGHTFIRCSTATLIINQYRKHINTTIHTLESSV